MNKKAAEMTIGTIIIIVLALIVLVVLVVGFTGGWSNLWGKITAFFGGGTNVDTIVQACQLACTSNSQYDYCDKMRTLKFEDSDGKLIEVNATTCQKIAKGGSALDKKGNSVPLPKVELSCEITCAVAGSKSCTEVEGAWQSNVCSNPDNDLTNQVSESDKQAHPNENCCKV